MKITRLHKIKGYRIFRDFAWPAADLPDFARFNVIYGWNGAGKTSLSNIFRHIQRRAALTEGQVEILVDQTRVSAENFGTAALPAVRTFNRDTVDRNVFEPQAQQFPPVFFLGEDSVEKQKRIEELKKELAGHVEAESRWDRKKVEASHVLDAFCAEEAKGIKNLLTVAGGGPFNNYNAANFKVNMLATEFVDGHRTAKLDVLDPFLHQYESEYHYLFERVYEEAHRGTVLGLEGYYAMPNVPRRLLEAFLAFRMPDRAGELFQKLEVLDYDAAKKTRILRFLHTYSHNDQVAEPDHDPSVLSETPAILREVLALIRNCDSSHFECMENLILP